MIRHSITITDAVEFLNEVYAADPKAFRSLLLAAFACNRKLASHPRVAITTAEGRPAIGLLAVLNSLFGVDAEGQGPLSIMVNGKTLRFVQTHTPEQPEKYAKQREDERLKGEENALPYNFDEQRVAKYLTEVSPWIGAGGDPIGFLIASHAALSLMAQEVRFPKVEFKSAAADPNQQIGFSLPKEFRG